MDTKKKIQLFNECGISISKIAEQAGISKTTISKWMNGTRPNITAETEEAIEEALMTIADNLNEVVYGNTKNGFQYDEIVLED